LTNYLKQIQRNLPYYSSSEFNYFSKPQLVVVKENRNFVVVSKPPPVLRWVKNQNELSFSFLMIRLGDHDALIISNEVVERLPNIEMLLEGETTLMFIDKESRVITIERIVYRRNSYHVAIAQKNGRMEVIERDVEWHVVITTPSQNINKNEST